MKRLLLLAALFAATMSGARAYDFSAVAPTGQTLYYNIVSSGVQVTSQNTSYPYNYYGTCPTGALTIPDSVTRRGTTYAVVSIGERAFYSCSGLTSVTIPEGVTSIGEVAFSDCSGLTSVTIPDGVISIGEYAFRACSGLTSVTIPSSVISIGEYAFRFCSGLTTTVYTGTIAQWCSITFDNAESNPLCYSHSLTINGEEITNLVIPEGITSIGNYAFCGCSGLISVTIPSSVTSIGDDAFYNVRHIEYYGDATGSPWGAISMNGITDGDFVYSDAAMHYLSAYIGAGGDVSIPSTVDTIGSRAFYGCSGLTSVTIPSSVTSIGNYAFFGCSGLTSVTIPEGVTSIGESAFYGCSGLTSVTIPSSVTSIGDDAFYNVRHIEYDGDATGSPWGAISMNGTTDGDFVYSDAAMHYLSAYIGTGGDVTIPSSVTSIGGKAFYGCSGLTSVTIPSSVTFIGGDAFYGCSGLTVMWMKPAIRPTLGNQSSINDSIIDLVVPHNSYAAYVNAGSYYTRHHIYCDTVFLSVNVNDTARGSVIGGSNSVYPYPELPPADTITLTALPNYGYHVSHWENGDTSSVRRLANITHDISVTAYFYKNQYAVTTRCDTSIHGYINAPAQSNYLDEVAITAHASHGYHFTQWQDGNTDNPRTFILTQDTHFVAYYDKNVYTLTFQSNDTDMGIVNTTSVSSEYLDTTMQIYATAIPHHHFVRWDDNNTENPRRFVFDDNHTYTAYFAIDEHTVSVQVDNLAHGTVDGAGTREYGQPITVSATPYSGYQFAHWSDGATYNPYTFAVLEDKSLTAIFIADGEPWQDTVVVYDTAYITLHDTAYITLHDTTYINVPVHDTTYITVTVTDTLWLTEYVHDTIYIHDTVYFTEEGIADVAALNAKVYSSQGQIVVEGADGNSVTLYDVNGRMLATKRDDYSPLRFDAPASGTYMIKIADLPARKVVVIK